MPLKGERLSCGCVLGDDYRFVACSRPHRETIERLMKERLRDLQAMGLEQGMKPRDVGIIKIKGLDIVVADPRETKVR